MVAEDLVGAVDAMSHRFGAPSPRSPRHRQHRAPHRQVFMGVVVLAMIGHAAENSNAVGFAYRNRMAIAPNIVTQASVPIALFATPVLMLLSFSLGHPLDLVTPFEIVAVSLAVAIVAYFVLNGESNWVEGVQLLALYTLIAGAIYFLP
jgi:Ca2+:H+ antiporter